MFNKHHNQSGQSLLELLVAMGVFVLIVSSTMFLTLDAQLGNQEGGQRSRAVGLAQEGVEAVKSLASRGWKYVENGTHGLSAATGVWEFGGTSDDVGIFSRTVSVADVFRDALGNIVTTGGTLDPDTKLVTTRVDWENRPNRPEEVLVDSYMTNWRSRRWTQTTQAEFDAGTKNQVVSASVVDGELTLAPLGGGEYGNTFVVNTSVSAQNLTNSAYRTSLRFTAQNTKTVNALSVYINAEVGTSPTYRYSLQADSAGHPSGLWLGSGTYRATSPGWKTIAITPAVTLAAGTTYHLVVQYQTGTIAANRYIALRVTTPDNMLVPLDGVADPSANVLTSLNNGGTWTVDNTQPLYELSFADGTYAGNPYVSLTENTTERIYRDRFVGELFTPPADMTVSAVTFDARKNGNPSGELMVALIDAATSGVLERGVLASATAITSTYAAYTYSFAAPVHLSAGTAYRIYAYSSVSNSTTNYFRIRRLDTDASDVSGPELSYRGTTSVLTYTINGGGSWTDVGAADIGGYYFTLQSGFVAVGDFISSAFDTGSSGAVGNYLTWTAAEPSGTRVYFQVRAAATQPALIGTAWNGPDGTAASYFDVAGQVVPDFSGAQWWQYRAYFESTGADTPVLSDVTINYEP